MNRTPDDYKKIADHELHEMLSELMKLPDLIDFRNNVNEFVNALNLMLRSPNNRMRLSQNAYHRAELLFSQYKLIERVFSHIQKEEELFEKAEKKTRKVTVEIINVSTHHLMEFALVGETYFGRYNMPGLPIACSRKHIQLIDKGSAIVLVNIGKFPTFIMDLSSGKMQQIQYEHYTVIPFEKFYQLLVKPENDMIRLFNIKIHLS